jgi:hypothetical protein
VEVVLTVEQHDDDGGHDHAAADDDKPSTLRRFRAAPLVI